MSKQNKTIDRIQAVWNKLGGEDGVDALLRDQTKIVINLENLPAWSVWSHGNQKYRVFRASVKDITGWSHVDTFQLIKYLKLRGFTTVPVGALESFTKEIRDSYKDQPRGEMLYVLSEGDNPKSEFGYQYHPCIWNFAGRLVINRQRFFCGERPNGKYEVIFLRSFG